MCKESGIRTASLQEWIHVFDRTMRHHTRRVTSLDSIINVSYIYIAHLASSTGSSLCWAALRNSSGLLTLTMDERTISWSHIGHVFSVSIRAVNLEYSAGNLQDLPQTRVWDTTHLCAT